MDLTNFSTVALCCVWRIIRLRSSVVSEWGCLLKEVPVSKCQTSSDGFKCEYCASQGIGTIVIPPSIGVMFSCTVDPCIDVFQNHVPCVLLNTVKGSTPLCQDIHLAITQPLRTSTGAMPSADTAPDQYACRCLLLLPYITGDNLQMVSNKETSCHLFCSSWFYFRQ